MVCRDRLEQIRSSCSGLPLNGSFVLRRRNNFETSAMHLGEKIAFFLVEKHTSYTTDRMKE